jgi:hypothetical protein
MCAGAAEEGRADGAAREEALRAACFLSELKLRPLEDNGKGAGKDAGGT